MKSTSRHILWFHYVAGSIMAATLLTACESARQSSSPAPSQAALTTPATSSTAVSSAAPPPAPNGPAPKSERHAVRIDAGNSSPYTDANGNAWLPDQGFADGETVERAADLVIANTKDPALYRTERWGMSGFSCNLPNGKYTVKLHFAETFEDITGPGQRVFSFKVQGKEFNDFDVFAKAGGALRAYVETVPVEISDGKLEIRFTSNIQEPEINGIEIVPEP